MRTYKTIQDVDFDHVFEITEAGEIIDGPAGIYAPELYDVVKPADFNDERWELLNGYSGQDRYSGPIMHDSEYVGGQLERDILETPGVYVLVASYYTNEDEEFKDVEPSIIEGWAIARLKVTV